MFQYKKYLISKTDNFEPTQFPNVVNELNLLKKNLSSPEIANKADILISHFKKSTTETNLSESNADISSLFSSGDFTTTHLKALFECSEGNKLFQKQYEVYLRKEFSDLTI